MPSSIPIASDSGGIVSVVTMDTIKNLGLQQVESGGLSYCNFISIPGIQHPLLSVDCWI